MIHLKPVSVVACSTPCLEAILETSFEQTIVVTTFLLVPDVILATWLNRRAPISSPLNNLQSPLSVGIATASRSPSGSFASARSAFDAFARSVTESMTPCSSGLGKDTVGKSASGTICVLTGMSSPA